MSRFGDWLQRKLGYTKTTKEGLLSVLSSFGKCRASGGDISDTRFDSGYSFFRALESTIKKADRVYISETTLTPNGKRQTIVKYRVLGRMMLAPHSGYDFPTIHKLRVVEA